MSCTRTGTPLVSATTTLPMSRSDLMRPMPRTLNDCSPSVMRCPPTFWLAFDERVHQLLEGQVLPLELIGVDLDVILLGVAAEADDVDDAGHLAELLLEDPVLRRLQVGERVALADDAVAEDLADGVPRRQLRLHPRRQLDELEAIDDLLPRVLVVDVPGEVALHVGEPEERLRADVVEVHHAGEPDLELHRDVALDLLGRPAVRLRDELDHRRHRVRVGLDVEILVAVEPTDEHAEGEHADDGGHFERERDQLLDHGAPLSDHSGEQNRPRRHDLLAALEAVRHRQVVAAFVLVDGDGAALEADEPVGRRCRSARTRPSDRRGAASPSAGWRAPCARRRRPRPSRTSRASAGGRRWRWCSAPWRCA